MRSESFQPGRDWRTLMIEVSENLCSCDTCVGTDCACGCQAAMEEAICGCSSLCACGVDCNCRNCAGASE